MSTSENFFRLIHAEVVNVTDLALYLYCKTNEGEPLPLTSFVRTLHLSQTAVVHHLKVLEILGLVEVDRTGKRNRYFPQSVSNEATDALLSNNDVLDKVKSLKDQKIDKYHPKGVLIRKKNILYKEDASEQMGHSLATVLKHIPKQFATQFYVNPSQLAKLDKFAEKVDLETYARWFMKYKLGKTVHSFNINIFLYPGIIDEYRAVRSKLEKAKQYKAGNKIPKEDIEKTKKELAKYG